MAAYVPWDGCLNYINENDEVMLAGFGRKGHAVGDIPGIRFKVIAVRGISLLSAYTGKKEIVKKWYKNTHTYYYYKTFYSRNYVIEKLN